jgi:hypothetical protein
VEHAIVDVDEHTEREVEVEVAYGSLELEPGTMEVARVDVNSLAVVVEDEEGVVELVAVAEAETHAEELAANVEDEEGAVELAMDIEDEVAAEEVDTDTKQRGHPR